MTDWRNRGPLMVRVDKDTWVDFLQIQTVTEKTPGRTTIIFSNEAWVSVPADVRRVVLRLSHGCQVQNGGDTTPEMEAAVAELEEE